MGFDDISFSLFPSSHPRKNAHQGLLSTDLWSKRACILFYHYPNHCSKTPRLTGLQDSIEVCKERGWVKDTYSEKFLLFTEEVGELAKAIRKTAGLYEEKARQKQVELEEEFADVLSAFALDLCGCGVYTLPQGAAGAMSFHDPLEGTEMEKAFREKEQVNQTRTWD